MGNSPDSPSGSGAHVFLCMLAYHVEWHFRRAWESLLLGMHPPKTHAGKKGTGRTDEELVARSYRDLLRELAGFTVNTHHPAWPAGHRWASPAAIQANSRDGTHHSHGGCGAFPETG